LIAPKTGGADAPVGDSAAIPAESDAAVIAVTPNRSEFVLPSGRNEQ